MNKRRVLHIKRPDNRRLAPDQVTELKAMFQRSDLISGEPIITGVKTLEPKWVIEFSVPLRDDVTDDIARQQGDQMLENYFSNYRSPVTTPARSRFDRRLFRVPAASRSAGTGARA
ncbi:MAG TPA: hypothetical protein VHD84_03550 [Candidatus Saccharimonadales bacterium]|nr:hypothetical protein [Candidatus Saccharimonadales bacterium]